LPRRRRGGSDVSNLRSYPAPHADPSVFRATRRERDALYVAAILSAAETPAPASPHRARRSAGRDELEIDWPSPAAAALMVRHALHGVLLST
jgi:hypothetical protein